MFNFEEFQTPRRKPTEAEPILAIGINGRITLNKSAYKLIGSPDAVTFLYDRQKNVLGLTPSIPGSPSVYRVRPSSPNSPSYVLNSRAAFRHFGIPVQRSHFKATVVGGVLIANLDEPISRIFAPNETNDDKDDE